MSRKGSQFGSDMNLVVAALNSLRKHGAAEAFWGALERSDDLARKVHDLVMAELEFTAPRPTYQVTVAYDWTFADRMQGARCHVYDAKGYTFPDQGKPIAVLDIELFNFHGTATRDEMLPKFWELGYRPISLVEALALLQQHADAVWDICVEWTRKLNDGDQVKELLVLGDRMEGTVPRVPVIGLATNESHGWEDTWFSLEWTQRDVGRYSQGYFVPAVKILPTTLVVE